MGWCEMSIDAFRVPELRRLLEWVQHMKTSLASVSVVAMLAAAVWCWNGDRRLRERVPAPIVNAEGTKMLGRLPVAFEPNVGQWEHPVRYVARIGAMTVFLEEEGWSFTLVEGAVKGERREHEVENASARGVAVRMTFAGARGPELVAEERLSGRHNYFLGNDPSKWRGDVPLY